MSGTQLGGSPAWLGLALTAVLVACQSAPGESDMVTPHLSGGSAIDRGRYMVIVAGCNDCHTEGYLQTDGNIAEPEWLLGSKLGWRGPWGTTYPPNLRLTVQSMTEDEWVDMLRTRKALPPMPWSNVRQMAESDARAMYAYIQSLRPAGERMPLAVPPEREPATPYLSLEPIVPGR